jgi:transposase
MRFYQGTHEFYAGIDLHTKSMYVCVLDAEGQTVLHRNIRTDPRQFLQLLEPYRHEVVVAAECTFSWYWLADLCADEQIPFVLGHALYMKAIHGGKVKNDKVDSMKIANLLRGGVLPQAYVYPPRMRGTRDLLRRRTHLVRKRAEALSHVQNTNSQYNLPPLPGRIAQRANRAGVPERFSEPAVRWSVEADLELVGHYDTLIRRLELYLARSAKVHDASMFYRLRSVPGIGKVLALVIMYEIHDISRFPRVQDFISYARLVKCSKESAGKKSGYGGKKIGNAHLKWAFSEATCLFMRESAKAMAFVHKRERKFGKGKAMSILAARLGRSVYAMLRRGEAFDEDRFFANA